MNTVEFTLDKCFLAAMNENKKQFPSYVFSDCLLGKSNDLLARTDSFSESNNRTMQPNMHAGPTAVNIITTHASVER